MHHVLASASNHVSPFTPLSVLTLACVTGLGFLVVRALWRLGSKK